MLATWEAGPSLTTARYGLAAAAIDGKLYAVGGRQVEGQVTTVDREFNACEWPSSTTVQFRGNSARFSSDSPCVGGACAGGAAGSHLVLRWLLPPRGGWSLICEGGATATGSDSSPNDCPYESPSLMEVSTRDVCRLYVSSTISCGTYPSPCAMQQARLLPLGDDSEWGAQRVAGETLAATTEPREVQSGNGNEELQHDACGEEQSHPSSDAGTMCTICLVVCCLVSVLVGTGRPRSPRLAQRRRAPQAGAWPTSMLLLLLPIRLATGADPSAPPSPWPAQCDAKCRASGCEQWFRCSNLTNDVPRMRPRSTRSSRTRKSTMPRMTVHGMLRLTATAPHGSTAHETAASGIWRRVGAPRPAGRCPATTGISTGAAVATFTAALATDAPSSPPPFPPVTARTVALGGGFCHAHLGPTTAITASTTS